MRSIRIAAALAAALATTAALAVTPQAQAERAAVAAAQAEYTAARDKAKKEYYATKKECGRLAVESRAACIDGAKALRKQSLAESRATYDAAVARAKKRA
jgi:opacity protein-like surface antigen